jgi:small-conductance mechanosensitive channel
MNAAAEPKGWLESFLAEAKDEHTLYFTIAFVLLVLMMRAIPRDERSRVKAVGTLLVIHVALVVAMTFVEHEHAHDDLRLAALIFAALAGIGSATTFLFAVVAPLIRMRVPRILRDVIGAAASIVAILSIASHNGLNLSGVIATSAVLTAVIGLSLQSTLGNVMAGLSVQLDNSVRVGDWIKVGDVVGKVIEIRWRSTSIETRNWETVVIPNSVLTNQQILVLGKRQGMPQQWRRWIYFNIDYRHAPDEVIATVTEALQSAPIERVAKDPPPNCILMDLAADSCRYAVRYWLTDLAVDDPTDSVVRNRIAYALRRANIPFSLPAHHIFMTEESIERKASKEGEEHRRRLAALGQVDFISGLPKEQRETLAAGLRHAPFTKGEIMTRQGAEAHWLYMLVSGEASVHVSVDGIDREVARLKAGNIFGEMSLMTGEPRSATVIAQTNVDCYRLDKLAAQEIISARPELAEQIAAVLANRKVELMAVKEGLDAAAKERRLKAAQSDITSKIRSFFGIDSNSQQATGTSS